MHYKKEITMNSDKLWDIHQLAKNCPAFSVNSIRWLIRTRRIPLVKIGKRIYFDPVEIHNWIQSKKIDVVNMEKL